LNKAVVALTVAGSDPGGGAGIQADLQTFMALGVEGRSVITALTAQNSNGIAAIHSAPAAFVRRQIVEVMADTKIAAAKTGMLLSSETVRTVADTFLEEQVAQVVIDPVLSATTGEALLETQAVNVMIEVLFPLALIVTPNLHEAAALTGLEVESLADMEKAALRIGQWGPQFVLIKGGHLIGDPIDVLFDGSGFTHFGGRRIESRFGHGTGCKLTAAITAYLAQGDAVPSAVKKAKAFIAWVLQNGFSGVAGRLWEL